MKPKLAHFIWALLAVVCSFGASAKPIDVLLDRCRYRVDICHWDAGTTAGKVLDDDSWRFVHVKNRVSCTVRRLEISSEEELMARIAVDLKQLRIANTPVTSLKTDKNGRVAYVWKRAYPSVTAGGVYLLTKDHCLHAFYSNSERSSNAEGLVLNLLEAFTRVSSD